MIGCQRIARTWTYLCWVTLAALLSTAQASAQLAISPSKLVFPDERLLATSASQAVVISNIGHMPSVLSITVSGDFAYETDCRSSIAASSTCTVLVSFRPLADGFRTGALTVKIPNTASPLIVPLSGYGIGIAQERVRLHYDFMVASDHTHDPEVVAPGAIQRVINAFAAHGVELIVDPHHTAIAEVQSVTFAPYAPLALCGFGSPNFYTIRNQYFQPKFADQ